MSAAIVIALLPVIFLIGFGHLIRRTGFLSEAFWPQAERLSYFVLLPALFMHGLATADLDGLPVGKLAGTLVVTLCIVGALLAVANRFLKIDGPAFTSVFQGGIRFNNYVGVTAAVGLFGPGAIALAAVANASIVPTVNVLCLLVFARYGSARPGFFGVVRTIVTNPLVVSCVIGIALQASGLGLPAGIAGFFKALGQASLPLGLLCVGAALDWGALGRGMKETLTATVTKFAIMPPATALIALAFGLRGDAALLAVMFQALPTASSSYVLARQLGGDAPLMASIIAFQTVLAAITVPATLILYAALI
ncbi:AEC family transporter [Pararhizobium haloflavum]|uniref:AEC family transporter n=1 Tax=Pararhizobium haloflavum TaxID=2037914 RepID=UPI000C185CB3|nr:AEC family transporter [Pararhizobium haloflavum]